MAYIGNKPTVGNFQICDAISVVNGQAAYTMQVGSVNVIPQSANHMIVSLNGTIQKPNSSFTVSGAVITFSSNLVTNDVIDFIQILGDVHDLGVPSDATVTAAKLNNDIISGSTELATAPADTDEFLVSDAGTLKRIDYSLIKGGGITEADQWRLTSNITSFVTRLLAKVIVEPLTVKEQPGFCNTPCKDTNMWYAECGDTLTDPTCIVYAAWPLTTDIASQIWKFPIVGLVPM